MKIKIIILFLLLGTVPQLFAQTFSTWGTDFWVAYLTNWHPNDVDEYIISISGSRACTAVISNPNTGWSHTVSVPANGVANYSVPEAQCKPLGSCTTRNVGLHITATDSVQVFVYNHSGTESSCDASNIYSTGSLGSEYIVQTYPFTNGTANACAEFCILAIQNNTELEITYHGATSTGIPSGATRTVTLNAGQVYQVQSPMGAGNGDFSGTIVTSNNHNGEPFAIFMGNTVTNAPFDHYVSADHTYMQALPSSVWQKKWIVVPSAWNDLDVIRITAKCDSTEVYKDGSFVCNLNRGETREINITTAAYITTSSPCELVQYLSSRTRGGVGTDWGDVAAFVPNAITCKTTSATFPSFSLLARPNYSNKYYVNVVFPTIEDSSLRLDGNLISTSATAIPGTPYSYKRLEVSNANHTLSTSGSGFMASAYGLAENWEAYIISLGGTGQYSTLADTVHLTTCHNPFEYGGSQFTQSGMYTLVNACNDVTVLDLTISEIDTIDFDTVVCDDYCIWQGHIYRSSGIYTKTVAVGEYGCDSVRRMHLQLAQNNDTTLNFRVCDSVFVYDGSVYDIPEGGLRLDLTYQSVNGCDSVVHINAERFNGYYVEIDTGSCFDFCTLLDTTLAVPGEYTFDFTTASGCDSTVVVHLQHFPSYYFETRDTIVEGQEYSWIDGNKYDSETDVNYSLLTSHGCDSVYHLILDCIPRDLPVIWTPNVFTPNKPDNQTFRVLSSNVEWMSVSVFHRWGERICTFDGLTESWDGTYKGRLCPQATYVYQIRYSVYGESGMKKQLFGSVTLLR